MLVLILVCLSALDGFMTIREGGLDIEGNPALRWLMGQDGWVYAFWLHKTVGVGACGFVLGRYRPHLLRVAVAVMGVVFVIHAAVVVICWTTDGCTLG